MNKENISISKESLDVIPCGLYCYTRKENGEKTICPHWNLRADKPDQNNGYCSFMGYGDWQTDGGSLLWDQCKECGLKLDCECKDGDTTNSICIKCGGLIKKIDESFRKGAADLNAGRYISVDDLEKELDL